MRVSWIRKLPATGKLERWRQPLKSECIRPGTPLTKQDARRLIERCADHDNTARPHSAIGYVTPPDMLAAELSALEQASWSAPNGPGALSARSPTERLPKNSRRQALGGSQDFSVPADSMVRSAELSLYRYPQTQVPQEKTVPRPSDYRDKLLSSVGTLPPLPTVLNQLLKVMNDANSSAGQISALIEKDGVLSGNVLRCVNSAYYGLRSRVSSIRHAVTLLGFETLRNLALAFSMRRMLVKPRPSSRKLSSQYSQHALGCAIMTQFLAHYTKSQDVDAAFAAGLFHDVGKLLIINTIPEMFPPLIEHWENSGGEFEDSERELLAVTHSQLSAVVLEKWKLSEVIQTAAAHHHDPGSCPANGDCGATLADLVHAADLYVRFYGLEIVSSAKRPPSQPDQAFERIGLIDGLPELAERFRAEFQSIRGVFQ